MARASVRPVLTGMPLVAACNCRVSSGTTGSPAAFSPAHSHCDIGPASKPAWVLQSRARQGGRQYLKLAFHLHRPRHVNSLECAYGESRAWSPWPSILPLFGASHGWLRRKCAVPNRSHHAQCELALAAPAPPACAARCSIRRASGTYRWSWLALGRDAPVDQAPRSGPGGFLMEHGGGLAWAGGWRASGGGRGWCLEHLRRRRSVAQR